MLLDVLLPDGAGLTTGRALREAASTRDVPIVIISGDRAALGRSTPELSGPSFLQKPFSRAAVQTAGRAARGPGNGAAAST